MTQVTDSDHLSAALDIESMRAAAAAVLAPDAFPRQGEVEGTRLLLRLHMVRLIAAVENSAATRPAESVPREVALAEARSARVLLTLWPEPGLGAAWRHVRILACEVRALCDRYDMLTGALPVGATS
ncbi:hypothetical protein GCM10018793_61780 [Streptomyces sulfonofaciens]|uniref:Uncharacterized protein n=1 Tax=Streptomyces sulfonofaciens TaxID=68272 RepID=A0A919L7V8_9ACTN|nr:DUF6415 family natural product biosynthesis protein [Streptomyces sulfonofaciens]GHH87133.1 hypothetical protein GCM10018793_61780 [Streptomyces sulfonofaciens]